MKWIGLAFLIVGALLAMDHQNWFVPVVIGLIILGYWYFVEREPDDVPPDESDYLHRDEQPTKLQESSTSFDLPDFAPFLKRLSSQITGGYTAKVIDHLVGLAVTMKHEQERSLEYEAIFRGKQTPLNIGLFKDDAEEITIFFHTPKPLADFIDSEIEAFLTSVGCSRHDLIKAEPRGEQDASSNGDKRPV